MNHLLQKYQSSDVQICVQTSEWSLHISSIIVRLLHQLSTITLNNKHIAIIFFILCYLVGVKTNLLYQTGNQNIPEPYNKDILLYIFNDRSRVSLVV